MSHHNSGPRAHALPIADITDMYAFPSPERSGRVVLVLNTVPYADAEGFLSDALIYRFRLRPVTPAPGSPALFEVAGVEEEVTIDCTFAAPTAESDDGGAGGEVGGGGVSRRMQRGTCVASTGARVSFAVNVIGEMSAGGLRAFAGPRWDPFFSDAAALVKTIGGGRLAFTDHGTILGDGKNVLSVVVELDRALLLGDATTVAVVGETLVGGPIPVRWERFGRPEVENAVLGMKTYDTVNKDLEIRDLFNAEDAFDLLPDYVGAYRARLDANLAYWDGLDGRTDWPLAADGRHPLTELLLGDFLVVDVSKPFGDTTFLEIERAVLEGREHETCGGRALNDDAMDTLYTLLVGGPRGPRISDGVDASSRPATGHFPYLASPNPQPPDPHAHP